MKKLTTMDAFDSAFDPENFRRLGHRAVDQLADYLARAAAGDPSLPVVPWRAPDAALGEWPAEFPRAGGGDFAKLTADLLARSTHLHHPRFVGHQVTAPLPLAALGDLVTAFLNNSTAVYEMGPAGTIMERAVVRWFARVVGYDSAGEGVLTSGGSVGNLTALLAARQHAADVWREGYAAEKLCVITSEQTHYCVKRAALIMGLGEAGVIIVDTDARYRMSVPALRAAYARAQSEGRKVMAVVASAGSTSTGAIDPLDAIADFCAEHDLWLHVDGAHGGAAAVSDTLRPRLAGIARAHSVVIDAHKMLLMPSLTTAVVFKNGAHAYSAFAQEAEYLFTGPRDEWFNLGQRTLECTKRMMSFKVYAALQVYGTDFFAAYVERMFDLARDFAGLIRARQNFTLAVEPECNIVCFRYAPPGVADVDAFLTRRREEILGEGAFYLVQTTLRGQVYLRTTLINPLTRESDLVALLDRVALPPG